MIFFDFIIWYYIYNKMFINARTLGTKQKLQVFTLFIKMPGGIYETTVYTYYNIWKTLKLSSHLGQEAVYLLWRLYLALLKQWNIAKSNIQHYCYHKIVHKNIIQNPHINKRSFLAILVFNAIISSIIKQRLRKFTHIHTTPILWPLEPSNLCHFSKLIWQWITICHVCSSTFMWWYTHF